MRIQHQLGADIIFAFDECTTLMNTREYQERSVARTQAWAERCLTEHVRLTAERTYRPYQALFAVIQGAQYEDLRRQNLPIPERPAGAPGRSGQMASTRLRLGTGRKAQGSSSGGGVTPAGRLRSAKKPAVSPSTVYTAESPRRTASTAPSVARARPVSRSVINPARAVFWIGGPDLVQLDKYSRQLTEALPEVDPQHRIDAMIRRQGRFKPLLSLARIAARQGRGPILTGTGGDEWLGLTPFLAADLIRRGRLIQLAKLVAAEPETLTSSFAVSHALLLNVLDRPEELRDPVAPGHRRDPVGDLVDLHVQRQPVVGDDSAGRGAQGPEGDVLPRAAVDRSLLPKDAHCGPGSGQSERPGEGAGDPGPAPHDGLPVALSTYLRPIRPPMRVTIS